MDPSEMLKVRDWLAGLVGGEMVGGGVNMVEPVADFDFIKDGQRFNVSIRWQGEDSKPDS